MFCIVGATVKALRGWVAQAGGVAVFHSTASVCSVKAKRQGVRECSRSAWARVAQGRHSWWWSDQGSASLRLRQRCLRAEELPPSVAMLRMLARSLAWPRETNAARKDHIGSSACVGRWSR